MNVIFLKQKSALNALVNLYKLKLAIWGQLQRSANYKSVLTIGLMLLLHTNAYAQAPSGSDIWLARLNVNAAEPISDLVAITNNNLYTNQPYFFDDTRLYFTQMVVQEGAENDMKQAIQQTDIMLFDIALGKTKNLTQSLSSEYSPTPLPNKEGMSVIRVNEQGKQELWSLNTQGQQVSHLAHEIEPVGYQVWLNHNELLLFVLGGVDDSGETKPHQLQRVNSDNNVEDTIIDQGIGASLYRFKQTPWFLYSKDMADEGNWLFAYHAKTEKKLRISTLPQGSDYFAVSPSGIVFTSDGKQLWQRQIVDIKTKLSPQKEWQVIGIKEKTCQAGISRIGVSPDESMVALVCPH
ncbi:hypothetical protein [Glaciecola petra]|uniref:Uncharacterized protein n=1 Tax=Glaciecola petra TaxID=3075602 RepID=A0ABU2ZMR7_9ALTE|nr:hypothetical protein [Aestuariibacter sp. P117]MDT0593905.1 hypothetical protein [Aestuariibacter sp. P117]